MIGIGRTGYAGQAGKPYDTDLGAHVFPYRNYRAEEGRWMSADPAGFPDGPSRHYYAAVPTMGLDPLGLMTEIFTQNIAYSQGRYAVTFDWSNLSFGQETTIQQAFSGQFPKREPTATIQASGEYNQGFYSFTMPGSVTVENPGDYDVDDAPTGDDWTLKKVNINFNYSDVVPVSKEGGVWEYTVRISFDFDRKWEREI